VDPQSRRSVARGDRAQWSRSAVNVVSAMTVAGIEEMGIEVAADQ
jgi:hypothetical protein